MSSESQSPAFPHAGCRWGQPLPSACLRPLAARHGPNTSVLIQQSIFKSQAARPRKSNYASQPCAPNANRAAFPWDIASQPMMKGSETESDAGWAELRLFTFLQRGYLYFGGRTSTHWSISAPQAPLQSHPPSPALHYPKWDLVPKQVRGRGGSGPGDEGQEAEITSPSHGASCEQRRRRERDIPSPPPAPSPGRQPLPKGISTLVVVACTSFPQSVGDFEISFKRRRSSSWAKGSKVGWQHPTPTQIPINHP